MMELSQASGRDAAILPTDSYAQSGANEANPYLTNRQLQKRARRICAGVGALVVLSSIGAPAQQQAPTVPIGDVYESGGGAPVYSDTYESSCESGNTSPYKGMNPLVCYGITGSPDNTGKCSNTGPTVTLWKQEGNLCIYCLHINPPLTDGFVIPIDEVKATESQGFTCGVDQTDPSCSAVCYGPGGAEKFKPPPGTKLEGTPGVPQQTPVMARKQPQQSIFGGPVNTSCASLTPGGPRFTADNVAHLTKDLAAAKAMVAKAKTYTDKNPWDDATQAISKKYFGNATPATQQLIRKDVNNVLGLLNGIKSITNTVYPAGADILGSPVDSQDIAYVHKETYPPEIFVANAFWSELDSGPDSQATTFVHEMSHLPDGASTEDVAYGQKDCEDLVWYATDPAGKILAPWHKMPSTGKAPADPLTNADSFTYFVNAVANQR